MVTHQRILYLGDEPGAWGERIGPIECPAHGLAPVERTWDPPDDARYDVVVCHLPAALPHTEALAHIQELLAVTPMPRSADTLTGPGGITLRVRGRQVRVDHAPVPLTLREFELLRLLLERQDEVLTADEISRAIWGYETFGSRNFVESHVSRLRAKLAQAGAGAVVTTVRGVGYTVRSDQALEAAG